MEIFKNTLSRAVAFQVSIPFAVVASKNLRNPGMCCIYNVVFKRRSPNHLCRQNSKAARKTPLTWSYWLILCLFYSNAKFSGEFENNDSEAAQLSSPNVFWWLTNETKESEIQYVWRSLLFCSFLVFTRHAKCQPLHFTKLMTVSSCQRVPLSGRRSLLPLLEAISF